MMSNNNNNQWETVTKSRKHKNLEKKVVAHKEKKKLDEIQPKLDEICMRSGNYVLLNVRLILCIYYFSAYTSN